MWLLLQVLRDRFTNAPKPKNMYLEDLVMKVERERVPQANKKQGSKGFDALLRASLQVGPLTPQIMALSS